MTRSMRRMVGPSLLVLAALATSAHAEEIKIRTQPLIKFLAYDGEFDSPEAALARLERLYNRTDYIGTEPLVVTLVNFRPNTGGQWWNGFPSNGYSVDRQICYLGSCWIAAGATIWTLSPQCPLEPIRANGVTSGWGGVFNDQNYPYRNVHCEASYQALKPDQCSRFGNPINASSGLKEQTEIDYRGLGNSLQFKRTYRSDVGKFMYPHVSELVGNFASGGGPQGCFQSTYLENTPSQAIKSYCFPYESSGDESVVMFASDGPPVSFRSVTGGLVPQVNVNDVLTNYTSTTGIPQLMLKRESNQVNIFTLGGLVLSQVEANGSGAVQYQYSDASTSASVAPRPGLLISMTDAFGRQLGLTYDARGQLATVVDPAGAVYQYTTDAVGNMTSVTHPGGYTRAYTYNEPANILGRSTCSNPQLGFPKALTGIADDGIRFADFKYRCDGRGASTEYAGSAFKYSFEYGSGYTRVINPLGMQQTISYTTVSDWIRPSGVDQPAGSGCAASTSSQGFDVNGNSTRRDGFNGSRSCSAYDLGRNLETSRVDGLSAAVDCASVTQNNAVLPTGARKTSVDWHPDWRLRTRGAGPGQIVTSVYNGQPDPFNGNAIASCAPTTALLPDGKPIAVLCKRVEQATTDANGAAGFSATLQSGVPARTTTWTYNHWGQVLTENGPRTDVNDTTTYTYYSDTSFTGEGAAAQGHYLGDLATVTNAAGKVTQYTKYNKHGQVLESIDPNGVLTVNTYDLRQRLLSTTVGTAPNARTTSYQYDPVGQLKRVTLPDQSWIGYDYDDAHRQVAVYDHKGNRVDYQLDNAGNRIGEQTKDPGGALKRQLSRSIDALGRVQQTTGRE